MNFVNKIVLSAALSVPMLAAPAVMAAPAGMSQACQRLYEKYAAAETPKAFAKGKTKGCGWKGPQGGISLAEARKRANAYCVADGGDGCTVVQSVR